MTADARRFDAARRERVLALVEAGWSLEEACASADITPRTVWRWLARGLAQPGSAAGEFTARLDAAREAPREQPEEPGAEAPWTPARSVADGDPFVWLSPDELETLTPAEQEQAREAFEAHVTQARTHRRRNGGGRL